MAGDAVTRKIIMVIITSTYKYTASPLEVIPASNYSYIQLGCDKESKDLIDVLCSNAVYYLATNCFSTINLTE